MSDHNPRDEFDERNGSDSGFVFPGGDGPGTDRPKGGGTEHRSPSTPEELYAVQVDALTSAFQDRQKRDNQARHDRAEKVDALAEALRQTARRTGSSEQEPAEEPAEEQADVPAPRKRVREKREKDALSPWQKRQLVRRRRPDPVTVGEELRADQMLVYDSELDEVDYTDEDDLPEMRDYMPIRFRRYGRLGIGGGLLYALFVISVSIILACMGWLFASDVLALNKEPQSAIVTIDEYNPVGDDPVVDEEGNTIKVDIKQVSGALKNSGMIEYRWLFELFSKFSHADTKIDPGTYDVSTELDYRALVTALQFGSGSQEVTRITFPESFTMQQIFSLLEENHISHVKDLEEAAANYDFDYDFLDGLPTGDPRRLEGYLFPDTYDFYQGESASVAIDRFLRNLDNKLTDELRSRAANKGLNVRELLTVASLIEKEAGSDDERATIASVIYNRLNAGMRLQLDSTVNYITGNNDLSVTIADTEIDDPYNTYMYEGLPPGPICNPGLASIQAAVDPESTDYWYWYAYDGVSTFFTNFEDFQNFVNTHPNN